MDFTRGTYLKIFLCWILQLDNDETVRASHVIEHNRIEIPGRTTAKVCFQETLSLRLQLNLRFSLLEFNSKPWSVQMKHLSSSAVLFFLLSYWLLVFLYFEFQIGKWSNTQHAVFYDSVLHNMKQPDRGSLDGSFHKVVVALVRHTG